jgi:hypothetical protein
MSAIIIPRTVIISMITISWVIVPVIIVISWVVVISVVVVITIGMVIAAIVVITIRAIIPMIITPMVDIIGFFGLRRIYAGFFQAPHQRRRLRQSVHRCRLHKANRDAIGGTGRNGQFA